MFNYSKISSRRRFLGLSQKELAAKTDFRSGFLSRLENGKNNNPQFDTLEKLAKALEVNIGFFSTL